MSTHPSPSPPSRSNLSGNGTAGLNAYAGFDSEPPLTSAIDISAVAPAKKAPKLSASAPSPLRSSTTATPALADRLSKWAPDVRQSLVIAEVLSTLKFEFASDIATIKEASTGFELVSMTCPSIPVFKSAMGLVFAATGDRTSLADEIVSQVHPPVSFWSTVVGINPHATPRTIELLYLVQLLANFVVMQFKNAFACPRPIEYSANIRPLLLTPSHGSFPASHACESYAAARFYQRLTGQAVGGELDVALRKLAHRMAHNRVVAGVHFELDNIAGHVLGETFAEYLWQLSGKGVNDAHCALTSRSFLKPGASAIPPDSTDLAALEDQEQLPPEADPYQGTVSVAIQRDQPVAGIASATLSWLAMKAKSELAAMGY